MRKTLRLTPAVIFILTAAAATMLGQNRFEGYSLIVDAGVDGSCPVHYQAQNGADIFIAGTGQKTAAAGIVACDGSQLSGNKIEANGFGKWCFQGPEPMYDIRLRNGTNYLWYPITKDTGFYNVKDFRPVTRKAGARDEYSFTDPVDYTLTIRNALAFIATRQGGTLIFPDGDYVVGTTDGNTRDLKFEALTLPSGTIIQGAGSNASIPTTNTPLRSSSTRIRLRNPRQSIFRIGGCTNQVTLRNIELLGNSALYGEAPRDSTGDYGVEGLGKWALDPATGASSPNVSHAFKFENVTFQNFDKGIYVHNANDEKCDGKTQLCGSWQFDYVIVDHGIFINNNAGVWIDTYNTDWKITNSMFGYVASRPPGDGIHISKAGAVLVEQSWGGGYNHAESIGGTFIWVGTIASLTVINSGSENGQRSIYMLPLGGVSSLNISVIGSIFSDKIELGGRINYISTGSFYGARTIHADPNVTITSTGDRFCLDPNVLPGRCTDESGKAVSDPGIASRARIMFQTGQVGDGTAANHIDSRPNFFGYNVEIGDGLLQMDPNITFSDLTKWELPASNRPKLKDGAIVYCKDCKKNPTGICAQGQLGTDGAFAKRINSQWRCD